MTSLLINVLPLDMTCLRTTLMGKKHLSSNKVKINYHLYLLRPGFCRFPTSHLYTVSSVKDPVKSTPLGWRSRPHPHKPLSPKIIQICVQQDEWDWQHWTSTLHLHDGYIWFCCLQIFILRLRHQKLILYSHLHLCKFNPIINTWKLLYTFTVIT